MGYWAKTTAKFLKGNACEHVCVHEFGCTGTEPPQLAKIKEWIREGRTMWLAINIERKHCSEPRWHAQACKNAHRAGVPWCIRFSIHRPWDVSIFATLRNYKYARVAEVQGETWLISQEVQDTELTTEGICKQAIDRMRSAEDNQALAMIDDLGCMISDEQETRRQKRSLEDKAALGGLRNPHESVRRLAGATACGDRIRGVIDAAIRDEGVDAEAVLESLGQTEVPQRLTDVAERVRDKVCEQYGTVPRAGKLQGNLMEAMAAEMRDPDDEVVRWMKDDCTPLGIECQSAPRGVFPEAASDELDEQLRIL